jgi:8-oxo-dGTP diphosphatase
MNQAPDTAAVPKSWSLAVRAVIRDERGRMLLLRRSDACRHFVGCWEWPGGKVDPGEDFASAVKREAREEMALEIELTGVAGATHFEAPAGHYVTLCLEARISGGKISLSHEHDQYAWVAAIDLPKLPLADQLKDFMLEYSRRAAVKP